MNKVLFILPENKLAPKGGPFAVGYYYKQEQVRRQENIFDFLPAEKPRHSIINKIEKIIKQYLPNILFKKYWLRKLIVSHRQFLLGNGSQPTVDFSNYDFLFFHETTTIFKYRNILKNYKGKILLQSHSPIPRGQEICIDMPQVIKKAIPDIDELYDKVDRFAFERADYIVFPCVEAEEPYSLNWSFFNKFKTNRYNSFKYILTGIPNSISKKGREEVLKQYDIPISSFVISYVGRHNTVKGYDILKDMAAKYLNMDSKAYVISAGREAPFKRLEHKQWKEIGFTDDPHSLISASDVFVLPNRVTYFDIVMMEVLSLGKIVIASRTGGNKFFERNGVKGVLLYDSIDEAVNLLHYVKNLSQAQRAELEKSNKEFFDTHLTVSAMYDNYIKVISEIRENDSGKN